MVGGHFSYNKVKINNHSYLPLLRRVGSNQLVNFLRRTSHWTSTTSSDPNLIAKPTIDPEVVSRNVKVIQIQTGMFLKSFIEYDDQVNLMDYIFFRGRPPKS